MTYDRKVAAVARLTTTVIMLGFGCNGAGPSPTSPPCDQSCQDSVALRGFRETLKQVFNGALQAQPVGPQDVTYTCAPLGGTAHITGTATSNADVGSTSVSLTYVFDRCRYIAQDTDPTQNYDLSVTGVVVESGTIAVQPGSTTSLAITSDAVVLAGSVYSPPISYATDGGVSLTDAGDAGIEGGCAILVSQNGNQLSGTICGRTAGVSL
jgi:hypothetical protein